jgi:uncharacterized protein YggE
MSRVTCLVLSLVFASISTVGAQPAGRMPPPPPTITTTGEATVKRAPDRAFVSFASETRAPKPDEAQKLNAETMTRIQQALRKAKIPADAIRTTAFDLREYVDWVNGKRVSRGYAVSNMIEARIDDVDSMGSVLDEAAQAGATTIANIRFDLKDRDSAEREALRLAVADARARAEAAASGANVRIAQIQSIEEQGGGRTPPPMPMMMRAEMAAKDTASTPIVSGELEIHAAVRLTATIEPR